MSWPFIVNTTTHLPLTKSISTSTSSKQSKSKLKLRPNLFQNVLSYFTFTRCFSGAPPSKDNNMDSSSPSNSRKNVLPKKFPPKNQESHHKRRSAPPPTAAAGAEVPGSSKDSVDKDLKKNNERTPLIAFREKYNTPPKNRKYTTDEAAGPSSRGTKNTKSEETQTINPKNQNTEEFCSKTTAAEHSQSQHGIKSEIFHAPSNFQPSLPSEVVAFFELTLPKRKQQGGGGGGAGTSGGAGGGTTMGNQGIRQHVETSQKTGVFHLSKAKLNEFPPELAKIVNVLRNLDLSDNKIPTIPTNISAFVNLKHLNLNTNLIEIIPDQIGQLTKLETLSLANNRIKTLPSTIINLQKLRDVNLSSNQLSVFPLVFTNFRFLTVLDLSKNRIPDVPDGIGGLQVVELILNQNQVRMLSQDLALCPNLKTLRLQENTLELTGIPMQVLADSQISLFSVEGNLFDVKQLSDLDGYERYMDRYTSTKKKLT